MSTLTQKERDEAPASIFGWPERRKYPILDCSDVEGAVVLIGQAPVAMQPQIKRNIMRRARQIGCASRIPKSWMSMGGKGGMMGGKGSD